MPSSASPSPSTKRSTIIVMSRAPTSRDPSAITLQCASGRIAAMTFPTKMVAASLRSGSPEMSSMLVRTRARNAVTSEAGCPRELPCFRRTPRRARTRQGG